MSRDARKESTKIHGGVANGNEAFFAIDIRLEKPGNADFPQGSNGDEY